MPRPTVTSERIDDVPLLIYWLRQMHIDKIIDRDVHLPQAADKRRSAIATRPFR